MKVFTNCTVVLEFEACTSYKEKCTWRKTITDNGGVISYILTKKASFFVVFNKKGTSISYKLRQCNRHNIPVVSPKYVQQCVTKNRLLDTGKYRLADINNNQEFGKGKIQTTHNEVGRGTRRVKKKVVTVNLSSYPSFLYGDVNAPKFDEDTFQLPKWALLINKETKKMEALEVHVATRLDCKFRYRLYAQNAQVDSNKVVKIDEAIVWYFQTVSEVLSGYEQLYRQYTNKPVCMVPCKPGSVDMGDFGSASLRMKIGKLSLLNEEISPQVAALTSLVWNEALTEVDAMLETPMKYIQEKQIIEAKVILSQLTDKLLGNHGDDMDKLIEEFYEVLPHKEQFKKSSDWTLREVIGKQDLCQLLSDIVAVSEATDWSPDTTVIAKYRAMGCHIKYVNHSDADSAEIYKILEEKLAKDGGKVHGLFRVRRTVEEVNFTSDIGNINLLSHASPCHNILGILSRGLLMPNIVADKMGVARTDVGNLGAGIYFSDNPGKSSQYSTANSQTGTRFMLMCNVSLGHCCKMYQSDFTITSAPEGFDCVQGVKSSNDNPSSFQDNEFVIYNPSQQCVKYLVEFSLPGDNITEHPAIINGDLQVLKGSEVTNQDTQPQTSSNTDIDISDIKDVQDPLAKVKAGLQGNKKEHIPLKSVHIRGKMMDMVAKVVVLQAYRNDSSTAIEAKYVFPLDDTAAVCGFEAFINGKHVIGEVKEKSKARKEYKEAVARGDGAYLMEEETPDVFSVSVGNLPPKCDVLIKITYISELQVQGEAIVFTIPASVAPWLRDGALSQKTQATTESVKVSDNKRCDISLMVAIEMPFDIRRIFSPSHRVNWKKTATKAVVSLPRRSRFDDGFQLYIYLAEVHVPRMWVEKHPTENTQACMLTFYPEFETQSVSEANIIILLDMSNSMKGQPEEQAKKVALLAIDNLPLQCKFNLVMFGSTYKELFPSPQSCNNFSSQLAKQFIQEASANLGSTELLEPLHATQILSSATLSSADQSCLNLFLISDGHVTQESSILLSAQKTAQQIRIFTLGVSSTVNHHLLRSISSVSGGTYQHFNPDTKSQWKGKLLSQLEKACQLSLTNVHVDWMQTNDKATPPTQAPNHIPCLFSGCRQVVYGFVESCTQATLKAKVGNNEISTMVSTVDLNITTGTMLHQLTARAVITDYENGTLDDDRIKHQVIKNERKQYIIDLSKKHSIVTPYTSFVAIEDRHQDEHDVSIIPSIADLIEKETVDILPYISWEPGVEDKDEDLIAVVKDIIKRGEIQESCSMVQAEDIYNSLSDYIDDIKGDVETLEMVYDKLGTFYKQNQAETIGKILAEMEDSTIACQLKRLNDLSENDYEAYTKYRSELRDSLCDKRHLKNVPDWLFEDELRNGKETMELNGEEQNNMEFQDVFGDMEMPCLMPPEINISNEDLAKFQQMLSNASNIPLPSDDDSLQDCTVGTKDANGKNVTRVKKFASEKAIFTDRMSTKGSSSSESGDSDSSDSNSDTSNSTTEKSDTPSKQSANGSEWLDKWLGKGTPKCNAIIPRKQIATKAARKSAPNTGLIFHESENSGELDDEMEMDTNGDFDSGDSDSSDSNSDASNSTTEKSDTPSKLSPKGSKRSGLKKPKEKRKLCKVNQSFAKSSPSKAHDRDVSSQQKSTAVAPRKQIPSKAARKSAPKAGYVFNESESSELSDDDIGIDMSLYPSAPKGGDSYKDPRKSTTEMSNTSSKQSADGSEWSDKGKLKKKRKICEVNNMFGKSNQLKSDNREVNSTPKCNAIVPRKQIATKAARKSAPNTGLIFHESENSEEFDDEIEMDTYIDAPLFQTKGKRDELGTIGKQIAVKDFKKCSPETEGISIPSKGLDVSNELDDNVMFSKLQRIDGTIRIDGTTTYNTTSENLYGGEVLFDYELYGNKDENEDSLEEVELYVAEKLTEANDISTLSSTVDTVTVGTSEICHEVSHHLSTTDDKDTDSEVQLKRSFSSAARRYHPATRGRFSTATNSFEQQQCSQTSRGNYTAGTDVRNKREKHMSVSKYHHLRGKLPANSLFNRSGCGQDFEGKSQDHQSLQPKVANYSQVSLVYVPSPKHQLMCDRSLIMPMSSQKHSQVAPCNHSATPIYSPKSASYSPTTPGYSPTSQACKMVPGDSIVRPPATQSYSPTSPSYSPTSPSYSPTSPASKVVPGDGIVRLPTSFKSTLGVASDQNRPDAQINTSITQNFETQKVLMERSRSSNTISKYYPPDFVSPTDSSLYLSSKRIANEPSSSMAVSYIGNQNKPTTHSQPPAYSYAQNSSFVNTSDAMSSRNMNIKRRSRSIDRQRRSRSRSLKRRSRFMSGQRRSRSRSLERRSRSLDRIRRSRSRSLKRRSRFMSGQRRSRSRSLERRSRSLDRIRRSRSRSLKWRSRFMSGQRSRCRSLERRSRSLDIIRRSRSRSLKRRSRIRSRQSRSKSNSLIKRSSRSLDRQRRSRSRSLKWRSRFMSRQSRSRSRSLKRRSRSLDRQSRSRSRSLKQRSRHLARQSRSRSRSLKRRSRFMSRQSRSRSRSLKRRSRSLSRSRSKYFFRQSGSRSHRPPRRFWIKRLRNRSISRSRSRSRSKSCIRRSRSRSLRTSRTKLRSRYMIQKSRRWSRSRSRSRSFDRRSRSRSLRRSRSRSRSRSFIRRSRRKSLRRSRSRSRSRSFIRRSRSRSLRRSRSRSRSRSFIRRSRSRSLRQSRSRSFIRSSRSRSLRRSRSRSRSRSLSQRSRSKSRPRNTVWQGILCWNMIYGLKYLYSGLRRCFKVDEDSTPEKPLYYFELSRELCKSLIGVSRRQIVDRLLSLGVKSLGIKTEENVHCVIASLLALITLVKKAMERQHGKSLILTSESVINYTVKDGKLTITIDGINATLDKDISDDFYNGLINWLEKKEKELPPLYNCLELGKTRMDFLSNLSYLFDMPYKRKQTF